MQLRANAYGFSNFSKAIDDLNQAIEIDPQNANLYLNRLEFWKFSKRQDLEINDLKSAGLITKGVMGQNYLCNAASLYLETNQCAKALELSDIVLGFC